MVEGRNADEETRRRASTAAAGEERSHHGTLDGDHPRGVVTCPHCGDTQALTRAQYPDLLGGTACHVLCGACGRVFRVIFDGRRHPRLPVSLPGRLFPSTPENAPDEVS